MKRKWKYLSKAIDKKDNTLDFMLSAKRNKKAAKRFFKKIVGNTYVKHPKVMGVDKNPVYPSAFAELQQEKQLLPFSKLWQVRYLNNRIEADYRFIKRRIRYKQ